MFLAAGKRLLSASTDGHVRLFALPELGVLSDFDAGLEPVDAVARAPGARWAHGFRVGSARLESTLELGWWSPQSGYAQGKDGRVQSLGSEPLRGSCRQGVRTLSMAECGEQLARAGVVGAALGN